MDVIDQGKLYMAGADCFGGIEELRMRQEIGEHGVLEATVWLLPDRDCREDSLIWRDLPVSLRTSDGEEHSCLFSGLVRTAAFCRIQGRPAVKLRALSHTVKLDGQKKDGSLPDAVQGDGLGVPAPCDVPPEKDCGGGGALSRSPDPYRHAGRWRSRDARPGALAYPEKPCKSMEHGG